METRLLLAIRLFSFHPAADECKRWRWNNFTVRRHYLDTPSDVWHISCVNHGREHWAPRLMRQSAVFFFFFLFRGTLNIFWRFPPGWFRDFYNPRGCQVFCLFFCCKNIICSPFYPPPPPQSHDSMHLHFLISFHCEPATLPVLRDGFRLHAAKDLQETMQRVILVYS